MIALILFYYVFGLAAILMTYFTAITVMRYLKGRNGKQEQQDKPPTHSLQE